MPKNEQPPRRRLRTGEEIEGVVCDFGMNGEGIVKDGAYPVFVPFAIVGERVKVQIVHAKKDYAFGELIEVLSASKDRVKPRCRYFGRCGGCDLQHLDRPMQEEVKRLSLMRTLRKIAGIDIAVPEVFAGAGWAWRNKLSLPFGRAGRGGKVVLGFYEKRSHTVVPLKDCPLHGEWAARLIAAVTEWANENGVTVYDEKTGKGLLRHLVARYVTTLSATLVVNGEGVPHIDNLARKLDDAFGDYALYISPNTAKTNVILGDTVRLVRGRERAQNLGKFSAVVSPLSFLQVNDEVRDAVYDEAARALDGFDGDVVELYSGVGLLTAELASRLPEARIVCAEIVPEAVQDAKRLMGRLGFGDRIAPTCADAADFMSSLPADGLRRALVLDPPRKGCDERVLQAAADAGFCRVVYISCNPATLARDLRFLLDRGYRVASLRAFDMFPQTLHTETVVTLEKDDGGDTDSRNKLRLPPRR